MNSDELPKRLPTRPLRNWLLAWRIWTGDPPDKIARGFDLDPGLVADLLGSTPPLMLDISEATNVYGILGVDLEDVSAGLSVLWDEVPESLRALRAIR